MSERGADTRQRQNCERLDSNTLALARTIGACSRAPTPARVHFRRGASLCENDQSKLTPTLICDLSLSHSKRAHLTPALCPCYSDTSWFAVDGFQFVQARG